MRELPGWTFRVSEESAGHYCARGHGPHGMSVERHDADPDAVLEAAIADARDLGDRRGDHAD